MALENLKEKSTEIRAETMTDIVKKQIIEIMIEMVEEKITEFKKRTSLRVRNKNRIRP